VKDGTASDLEGIESVPGKSSSSSVVLIEDIEQCNRSEHRRRAKAFKATSKKFSLTVGKDINLDRVKHLSDCAMVGRLENVKVPFKTVRDWIKLHWKPILHYSPLFSTLINGWYIFHFLTIKDRERITAGPWLIGRGSLVLHKWSTGFNPAHERVRV